MQNYQNPKPSTDIWKSLGLLPETTHLEILLYIEFWTFNSPKVVKYGIFMEFQNSNPLQYAPILGGVVLYKFKNPKHFNAQNQR